MFVVFILNSTFTASVSARFTAQSFQPAVTDVNKLVRDGVYVGCQEGSFIYSLLQGEFKNKIRTCNSSDHCNNLLLEGSAKGGIDALFAVKPYAKLFLSKYCGKYKETGTIYPTGGFAYVFQKGFPLVADVSRAVVELTENGRISEIEGQWIKNPACNETESAISQARVSLEIFRILFGITSGITATCLLIFLVTYLYKNRDSIRRISYSSTTILSKVRALGKLFDRRDPDSFQSSRYNEDEEITSPRFPGNDRSSTVVPKSPKSSVMQMEPPPTQNTELVQPNKIS